MNRQLQQLENAMAQALMFEIVMSAIALLVTLTLLYWVIRIAVRDGMTDANRTFGRSSNRRTPELRDGLKTSTPDMRAD